MLHNTIEGGVQRSAQIGVAKMYGPTLFALRESGWVSNFQKKMSHNTSMVPMFTMTKTNENECYKGVVEYAHSERFSILQCFGECLLESFREEDRRQTGSDGRETVQQEWQRTPVDILEINNAIVTFKIHITLTQSHKCKEGDLDFNSRPSEEQGNEELPAPFSHFIQIHASPMRQCAIRSQQPSVFAKISYTLQCMK